jgi:hypothetical protein
LDFAQGRPRCKEAIFSDVRLWSEKNVPPIRA